MNRNIDLIREILIYIEKEAGLNSAISKIEIDDYSTDEVTYHVKLLHDARLIEGNLMMDTGGYSYFINGITWNGHEFLDSARDNNVWNKTKTLLKEKLASTSLEVLKYFLIETSKEMLK